MTVDAIVTLRDGTQVPLDGLVSDRPIDIQLRTHLLYVLQAVLSNYPDALHQYGIHVPGWADRILGADIASIEIKIGEVS